MRKRKKTSPPGRPPYAVRGSYIVGVGSSHRHITRARKGGKADVPGGRVVPAKQLQAPTISGTVVPYRGPNEEVKLTDDAPYRQSTFTFEPGRTSGELVAGRITPVCAAETSIVRPNGDIVLMSRMPPRLALWKMTFR